MKERLKELLLSSDPIKERDLDDDWGDGELDEIVDHLLTNGVIVLPCKVVQTVYRVTKMYNGKIMIVEGMVFEFAITHESSQRDKYRFYFCAKADKNHESREYSIWCEFAEFGKTVFFTRAEAEKATKERI